MVCILLLILMLAAFCDSADDVRYVRPNDSSPLVCPGQVCLTLQQYTEWKTAFSDGSTFVFLAGSHTLEKPIILRNVSNITFQGVFNATVLCREEIVCENITNFVVSGLNFRLEFGNISKEISALIFYYSTDIFIKDTMFETFEDLPSTSPARAILAVNSTIKVIGCLFQGNCIADFGGGLCAMLNSSVILNSSYFLHNRASMKGGAVYVQQSSLVMNGNVFEGNQAGLSGGALAAQLSTVHINEADFPQNASIMFASHVSSFQMGSAYFSNNVAELLGGALYSANSTVTFGGSLVAFINNSCGAGGGAGWIFSSITANSRHMYFEGNRANFGGAAYLMQTTYFIRNTAFVANSASIGGAVWSVDSQILSTESDEYSITFAGNTADSAGALYIFNSICVSPKRCLKHTRPREALVAGAKFVNNTARSRGGAVYLFGARTLTTFKNTVFIGNSLGGIYIIDSMYVNFTGTTKMSRNMGRAGGAITVVSESNVSFSGRTIFDSNHCSGKGGAISASHAGTLWFNQSAIFLRNTADSDGGAIYARQATIIVQENTSLGLFQNSAENGGALYLGNEVFLILQEGVNLTASYNKASKYGGVVYHEDVMTAAQCQFTNLFGNMSHVSELPRCFINPVIHLFNEGYVYTVMDATLSSYNNSAREGSLIYGGLLDRCRMPVVGWSNSFGLVPVKLLDGEFHSTELDAISSPPYQLCFCTDRYDFNCTEAISIDTHRGQRFTLYLIAIDQSSNPKSTEVTARVHETARLNLGQSFQTLPPDCSNLTYSLYSTEDTEELILYLDGPCRDTGVAKATVNVTLLPCPDGFTKSNEECVCEERLRNYAAKCTIDNDVSITRGDGPEFWVSALYENGSYRGLILYKTCPVEFCKEGGVTLTLDDPDIQCADDRSGLLCGACATNFSLMFGSSRCKKCSNTYLTLLVPFAAAGVTLVIFLSSLRLTVATGMINSVILYANIVQVNRDIFFPSSKRNVLFIFIAWMNLDLGFETCFYDGMTAYAQTWLQLAFPLYVWFLISFIIFASRYSITLSKLIGHNPIAVLATLLLMSYTKILKVITTVYSSVTLDYPDNKVVSVWLKDANVSYLQSWHLLLTVVTSLMVLFFFLPYTLLLLLGYKLYRISARKYLGLLMSRLKPLLDSYYAPYKPHTRYWTGFLLLVRSVLYIVFSFNSLGAATKSLLAIIVTFSGIGLAAGFILKGSLYTSTSVSLIEAAIYFNLITLSGVTLTGYNTPAVVYLLLGKVFVIMIAIVVYHFHITYTAKSALCVQIKTEITRLVAKITPKRSRNAQPPPDSSVRALSSHDPRENATTTVIDLREPLLESMN